MYSLPIGTYSDYWRGAASRSKYIGGAVLICISTTILYAPALTFPQISGNQSTSLLSDEGNVSFPPSEVTTVNVKIEDYAVPYDTEYQETKTLPPGMSEVEQEGAEGQRRKVVRTVSIGGNESYQKIYQFELKSPKKRVVMQNSQPVTGEKLDIGKLKVSRNFQGEATAYTYTGYCTASGLAPRVGLVAVDPTVIPLGSMLYIEGYGYAVAADTGGAIKGRIIDVFFDTLRECINWGRRSVEIYVLESSSK